MKSDNKNLVIALAAILLAAFFMPWLKFFVSVSAWDMVFGNVGDMIDSPVRYLAIIMPVSGLIIIYSAAFNNEKYPISKQLLFALPLITLIIIGIIIIGKIGESGNGGEIGNADVGELIKAFGIGFWLTLISSIILPFKSKKSIIIKPTTPAEISHAELQNFENQISPPGPDKVINKPENKITSQQINKPLVNFQTMSKQRKFVLIAAAVGIISMFLPWISVSVSIFGYTQNTQSYNGMRDIGILVFLCFIVSGAIAYLGDQTKNLDKTMWGIVLATGALALLCIIGFYSGKSSASIMGSSQAGFGLYIAVIAAIGVLVSAYLFRSPTDNIKDSFTSMKQNIQNKLNTPGNTTTNTPDQNDSV
jgi:hypothetical protein